MNFGEDTVQSIASGKSIPGRGNSQCKDPDAGLCLAMFEEQRGG